MIDPSFTQLSSLSQERFAISVPMASMLGDPTHRLAMETAQDSRKGRDDSQGSGSEEMDEVATLGL